MVILDIHDSGEKLHSAGEDQCVLRYSLQVAVRARRSLQANADCCAYQCSVKSSQSKIHLSISIPANSQHAPALSFLCPCQLNPTQKIGTVTGTTTVEQLPRYMYLRLVVTSIITALEEHTRLSEFFDIFCHIQTGCLSSTDPM